MDIRIPIAMATDENYAMPTTVTITSILENASENTVYNFYLLVPGVFSSQTAEKIALIKVAYPHCDIHFVNMKDSFSDILLRINYVKKPTCYRLMLADILLQCDKCIYLDSDVIVQTDLTELFSIDLDGFYLGGIKDVDFNDPFQKNDERYKETGLCAQSNYINTGVLLMNLKKIRHEGLTGNFLREIKKGYKFADQDVLNITCLNKIKYLPVKYNMISYLYSEIKPYRVYHKDEFDEAKKNPLIIHYAASYKPWLYYGLEYDDRWFKYFKISIFKSQNLKRKNGKLKIFSDKLFRKMNYPVILIKIFLMYWKTQGLLFALRKVKKRLFKRSSIIF
ncbi:MAG TPA: glycosyltransferase family 8 protein [Smithella sp.]|nr:glycosyltransferase family 8 protein [Smithella sp.]